MTLLVRTLIVVLALRLMSIAAMPARLAAQVIDLRTLDLPTWTLEEEFRLGSIGGLHDAFTSPRVQVDGQGLLLVTDIGREPSLKLFDADGRFLRQIGSFGEGPGEYRNLMASGFHEGTIWISDDRSGRLSFYDLSGALIEARRVSDPSAPDARAPLTVLPSGELIGITPLGPRSPREVTGDGLLRYRQFIVRMDAAGERVDTVAGYDVTQPVLVFGGGGRVQTLPFLISDEPLVSYVAASDRVREVQRRLPTSADAAEFTIVERSRAGDEVRRREFRDAARALTPPLRDSLLEVVENHYSGASPDAVPTALRYLELSPFLPPVSAVSEARDGTTWVRRGQFVRGGVQYLILDAALNPMATLTLPPTARGLAGPFDGDHLWVVERDELEVPYLVRYRVRQPE